MSSTTPPSAWLSAADAAAARFIAGQQKLWLAILVLAASALAASRIVRRAVRYRIARRLQREGEPPLVTPDAIHPGMPAALEVMGCSHGTRAEGVVREARGRVVAVAMTGGVESSLPRAGAAVRVTLAAGPAALQFDTSVMDCRAHTVFVARPQWLARIQRRSFFRVPVSLPAVLLSAGSGRSSEALCRATIADLSAGGFRALLPAPLREGQPVRVRLSLFAGRDSCFAARVVRSGPIPAPQGTLAASAQCEFVDISEDTRNQLVSYCFGLERNARSLSTDS